MKKCYLLVRKFDNAIVETCEKVYTSYEFAMKMLEQVNDFCIGEGLWTLLELDIDEYKTANDLLND